MQHSRTYIIVFSLVLTIVLGGALAFASESLKERQTKARKLDKRKQILKAMMDAAEIDAMEGDAVLETYKKRISSIIVDANGDEKTDAGIAPEEVSIAKEYKKPKDERLYPVFRFMNDSNPDKAEAYIVPVYGNGLWDKIWGFVAVGEDLASISGAVYDHKGETPGLGARISDAEVQNRFKGRKIYSADGGNDPSEIVKVNMVKGETGKNPEGDYLVDGMSGATITANGLNDMLANYLTIYKNYFDKMKRGGGNKAVAEVKEDIPAMASDSTATADSSAVQEEGLVSEENVEAAAGE